jgi:hypothetical protein
LAANTPSSRVQPEITKKRFIRYLRRNVAIQDVVCQKKLGSEQESD